MLLNAPWLPSKHFGCSWVSKQKRQTSLPRRADLKLPQLPQITTQTLTAFVVRVNAVQIITGCAHFASLYHGQHDNGHLPSPQVCLRGIGPTAEESPVSSCAELASTADGLSMGANACTRRLAVRTLGQCTNS